MTTGMRTEPKVETRQRRKFNWNWLWLIPALIIASALIGYATTPKPPRTGNAATTQSVQSGGTGSQGSVGHFREQVQPRAQQNGGTTGGPINTLPTSRAQGKGVPAAESTGGTDAGAGVSGITSTQEGLGGATPRNKSGAGPDIR